LFGFLGEKSLDWFLRGDKHPFFNENARKTAFICNLNEGIFIILPF
jgi:hypothetical protein